MKKLILIALSIIFIYGCAQYPDIPFKSLMPDKKACIEDSDCVPDKCCHADEVINKKYMRSCSVSVCTTSCEGLLDCGKAVPACINSQCATKIVDQRLPIETAQEQELTPDQASMNEQIQEQKPSKHESQQACEYDWNKLLQTRTFSLKSSKIRVFFRSYIPYKTALGILKDNELEGRAYGIFHEAFSLDQSNQDEVYKSSHALEATSKKGEEIKTACKLERINEINSVSPDITLNLQKK